jgi:integrase
MKDKKNRATATSETTTQSLAELALAAAITQIGRQPEGDGRNPLTVNDALDDYWEEHGKAAISAEQIEIASDYLRAHFGSKRIVDLMNEDFDDPRGGAGYAQKRRAGRLQRSDKHPARAVGDSAIRRELAVLAAALHHETREKNPVTLKKRLSLDDMPHIKRPSRPPPRDRWLTVEEEDAFLAACVVEKNGRLTRIYRFVVLALDTAARKEALLTLKWAQVDLAGRIIQLNPTERLQTKKRRPPVRISNRLHGVLVRAFNERLGEYVLDHDGHVRRSFAIAAKRAGLERVTPHVLRHTWATRAARNGVSAREIADVLGDDVQTVERNYMHHHPDFQRNAINWREREGRSPDEEAPR